MLRGILESDFSFVATMPVIGDVLTSVSAQAVHDNAMIFKYLIVLILALEGLKHFVLYRSGIELQRLTVRFGVNLRKKVFDWYMGFGKLYFDGANLGKLTPSSWIWVPSEGGSRVMLSFSCLVSWWNLAE